MKYLRPMFPPHNKGDYVRFKNNDDKTIHQIKDIGPSSQYKDFRKNPKKWSEDNPNETEEPNYYMYQISNTYGHNWYENANKFIGVDESEISALKYNL